MCASRASNTNEFGVDGGHAWRYPKFSLKIMSTWPLELSPQQMTAPSVFTAHVWRPPAATAVKVPAGGLL